MSQVTDPVMLDSTGQIIVSKLQDVIDAINGGTIDPLTVTQNGTYTPSGTTKGYGPVTVNVGGGNAYADTVPPPASLGENGQYYFELCNTQVINGLQSEPDENANTGTAGWEFTANENLIIVGARGYARSTYTGTIKLADTSGTVLAEKSVSLVANGWVSVMFDTPVTLTAGSNYIIMLFGNSKTLRYQTNPTVASQITYVRGRYGSLPGSMETGTAYSVDILIQDSLNPPYPLKTQYYKTGGVWVPV